MKRKFFRHNFKKTLKYTIPKFEMPAIKIVDLRGDKVQLSILYFTFKMVRRLEPNLLRCDVSLCVPVFLHLVIGEKFRG